MLPPSVGLPLSMMVCRSCTRPIKINLWLLACLATSSVGRNLAPPRRLSSFCKANYGVDFPLSSKIEVKGASQHPLYKWLTSKTQNGVMDSKVRWNFQKYLVDENGQLIDYFYSTTKPMSSKIVKLL